MGRIDARRREDLPQFEEQFAFIESVMGFLPSSVLTMGRRPELLEGFQAMVMGVMTMGQIDMALIHLVSHVASKAAGCNYCQAHTAAHAAHDGVDPEKLEAIWEFEFSDRFSAAERAALRLARDAAMVPNATTAGHFDELRHHYTDDQILQIVAVIAMFGFLNRWNDTMATTLEEVPRSFAAEHLTESGWRLGRHT